VHRQQAAHRYLVQHRKPWRATHAHAYCMELENALVVPAASTGAEEALCEPCAQEFEQARKELAAIVAARPA
jgi:hypothetical protein